MNNYSEKPIITLIAATQGIEHIGLGSEELVVYAARTCFRQGSAKELLQDDLKKLESGELSPEEFEASKERTLENTAGKGHGSVLDHAHFSFNIEGLPRLVTLHLCQPQYAEHTQQSLRRVKVKTGFYLPKIIEQADRGIAEKCAATLEEAFQLYKKMESQDIPGEDARFVLPLYTRTNILTTINTREMMHLHSMSKKEDTPTVIKESVEEMMRILTQEYPALFKDRGFNYEILEWMPSASFLHQKTEHLRQWHLLIQKGKSH